MLIAKESTYTSLASFTDVEQMNEIVRAHRSAHDLSPTELEVLDVLARHSCKYPGVSFLTKNNIAGKIAKSRRTIIRTCKRLESLGIIAQHSLKRTSDMQQTSNAIVIMAEVTKPEEVVKTAGKSTFVTQDVSRQEALKPVKQNATKEIDTAIVVSDALRNSLPSEVFDAFATYFNAEEIYKYYGVLLRAKRKINRDILIEHCPAPFTDAIHAVVLKAKQGVVRNMTQYFYRAFESATSQASRLLSDVNAVYYDWTEDEMGAF